jgi:hypothetical protein
LIAPIIDVCVFMQARLGGKTSLLDISGSAAVKRHPPGGQSAEPRGERHKAGYILFHDDKQQA